MSMLRSTTAALLAFILFAVTLYAQNGPDPAGTWSGAIEIPGTPLNVTVTLERRAGGAIEGRIDIPAQNAKGLPLSKVEQKNASIAFAIGGIPGEPMFRGTVDGDRMSGTFSQGGASFPFTLARASSTTSAGEAQSRAAKLDSIRAFLNGAIERWNVPGIGVAIVHNGEVVLAEGFGLRDREKKTPVTANTLMPIGSTTKSFTAFVLGTLVAEHKLDWDKPVVEYLPEFRLADEAHTQTMRVRDLLTHVSGLPRHDALWYGSTLTRAELFSRLRYLEPNAPVRTKWQYQNLMYMTAGVLAERVSGKSWETLVDERILRPLGMSATTTSIATMRASADHAVGYERREGKLTAVDYRSAEAMGPAGSINSSAAEMARWIQLQIDKGEYKGTSLIERSVLAQIHAPQVVMTSGAPSSGAGGNEHMLFNLYAMGWMEHAYRGRRLIEHGGNIDGFSTVAGFLPKEKLGVVVLANRGATGLPNAAMFTLFDIMLGVRDYDWEASGLASNAALDSIQEENEDDTDDGIRVPNTRPSHALEEYAGEYEHPAYGTIRVREERDRLTAELNGVPGKLEHYHYDVFRLSEGPEVFDGLLVEFRTATTGEIGELVVPLEPAVDPIEFERRPSKELSSPAVLDRYVGEYILASQSVTVRRRDSTLIVTVSGQPDYELVPTAASTFELKGMPGFSVRFTPRNGNADQIVFIQPNGTFAAKRK
jgi:CubicO group peptidase (beta-lactamase class C family)